MRISDWSSDVCSSDLPKWPFSRKLSEPNCGPSASHAFPSTPILIIAEYQRSITVPPRRNAQHGVRIQAAGQMLVEPAAQMGQCLRSEPIGLACRELANTGEDGRVRQPSCSAAKLGATTQPRIQRMEQVERGSTVGGRSEIGRAWWRESGGRYV